MKQRDYPYWNYPLKKLWLRAVRMRWRRYRSAQYDIRTGCVYFPDEVYDWLQKFDEMDKLMKDYYKNA